jgi:hypothetical protein
MKKKSVEKSTYDLVVANTFRDYYQRWKKETRFSSSSDVMFGNSNYQAIIKMGWDAVPCIIDQLREEPDHLLWALQAITKACPVKKEHIGHINDMAADYIDWYDNLKYIKIIMRFASLKTFIHKLITKYTFQKYYKKWDKEIKFISSSHVMFENRNYQEIIKMGWDVVPCIIEQLRKDPHHLFMALRAITGATPVKPEHVGRLYDMADDWINWYDTMYTKN